ncbi:MAG TPA: class I SAM-dependent methyltransferase [Alphaproteobacteria bacterium]|jgi:SAM-dependent methyltransferase|nr:class I SAM-dependent methyltransferase [Alphaproteobacteria bacterium]
MNSDDQTFDLGTLQFYDGNAETYSSARPDEVSSDLMAFLPNLKPGCRILELGCGSGRDAAEMEALGFDVDATDGAPAMAALASKRLIRPARVMRFDELDVFEGYDAIVACAALLHVPRSALPAILAGIWRALRPGGWHFASYKTAGAKGWDLHKRYYNHLSYQEAEQIYAQAGVWASLNFDEYDGVGHFSAPSRWLTVTGRKGLDGG